MFYKTGVFCQKKTLVQKEEEEYKNYVKMLWLITKSAYVIYEWPLRMYDVNTTQCYTGSDPRQQHLDSITSLDWSMDGKLYVSQIDKLQTVPNGLASSILY